HLHVPGPDALANPAGEARAEAYEVEGTPTLLVNGKEGPRLGGPKASGEASFAKLSGAVNDALEAPATAALDGSLTRKGDRIAVQADGKIGDGGKPGDKLRLRVVLVEEELRYACPNGQRLHHQVVRAFPGGVAGVAVKEATFKHAVEIDVGDVAKDLD